MGPLILNHRDFLTPSNTQSRKRNYFTFKLWQKSKKIHGSIFTFIAGNRNHFQLALQGKQKVSEERSQWPEQIFVHSGGNLKDLIHKIWPQNSTCPRRSNHLRQNAKVPKFSLITFSNCFARGNLKKNAKEFSVSRNLVTFCVYIEI